MEDNYKPSKEFSDRAWSEMKALLDKEMPDKGAILLTPEQGGRSNGLLLLLPLLLLMAIVALFFYYQTNKGQSDAAKMGNQETTELALLPQIGANDASFKEGSNSLVMEEANNGSISESGKSTDSNTSASLIENPQVKVSRKSIVSKSFNEEKVSNLNKQKESTNTSIETPIVNVPNEKGSDNKEMKELPMPFVIPNTEKYFEPLEDTKVELEAQMPKAMAVVEAIEGKLLMPLASDTYKANVDKFQNIIQLKNRRPIFASIGLRNYDFSNKIDLVVGGETVFRKKDKKLGLRTGLNYAQRSTTYLTREQTISIANFAGVDMGIGLETGQLEDYYNSRAQLNSNPIKYHFLEVPLFLDYKFSKKWSMHGGLSGKALIYSSVQRFGLLNGVSLGRQDSNLASADPNPESIPEGDEDLLTTSYFEPQQFNLGLTLGVNFQVGPRLGLQARFSQNLLDVYSELAGKQRSNSAELGVNWRLR